MSAADTAQKGSPLDRIKQKRARLAADTTHDIPVAGYGGELVVRYRLLDPLVEGKEIGDRIEQQFANAPMEQRYYVLCDSMIEACEGLYLRDDDGKLAPIDPEGIGPCRFDERLVEGLELPIEGEPSARKAVLALFGDNRNAVVAHGMKLQRWFSDTSGELGAAGGL